MGSTFNSGSYETYWDHTNREISSWVSVTPRRLIRNRFGVTPRGPAGARGGPREATRAAIQGELGAMPGPQPKNLVHQLPIQLLRSSYGFTALMGIIRLIRLLWGSYGLSGAHTGFIRLIQGSYEALTTPYRPYRFPGRKRKTTIPGEPKAIPGPRPKNPFYQLPIQVRLYLWSYSFPHEIQTHCGI